MGTSWYFSWKLNYFGIPKWKQGLFNIPQSGHESVYLLEPSFHSRTPNNSTFMKNISWCPCLKVRVNFLPRRNYAAHFTVIYIDNIYKFLSISVIDVWLNNIYMICVDISIFPQYIGESCLANTKCFQYDSLHRFPSFHTDIVPHSFHDDDLQTNLHCDIANRTSLKNFRLRKLLHQSALAYWSLPSLS